MGIRKKLNETRGKLGFVYYTRLFTPVKAFFIRKKRQINVIFIITELGCWKTEKLYLQMRNHPRFNPTIRVLSTWENRLAKEECIAYLKEKQYDFEVLDSDTPLQKDFKADIIFYQKPYLWVYSPIHTFLKNRNALFAYVSYGFHNVMSDYICNQLLHNYCWQYYVENESCAKEMAATMDNKGRNLKVTGVPMGDSFLLPRSSYKSRWKPQAVKKKRIIWAPHFSITSSEILLYSTFLMYADFMVEIAQMYASKVQFLFKPHPLLLPRLYDLWGKEKADAYYELWASMENTQVELGQYVDFFMTSDAMIHDCSSFTVEYMYTCKPVMYLNRENVDRHDYNLCNFAKQAYRLHYMGYNENDIENFIVNVVNGHDVKATARQSFWRHNLIPPNGKTASKNIIDAILRGY